MSDLLLPDGAFTGCLERESNVGEVCARFSEEIESIPREHWAKEIARPDKPTLRPLVKSVFYQRENSCASAATTASKRITGMAQDGKDVLLNYLSLYRWVNHGRDAGSSIDTNLAMARSYGILPQSYWSLSEGWEKEPPKGHEKIAAENKIDEFFDIEGKDRAAFEEQMGTSLLVGLPFVFGYQIKRYRNDRSPGGHAVLAVELISDTEFIFLNSWNETWGDNGFGTMKLSDVHRPFGCFAPRSGTFEPATAV
jgi:hypothetical protein